MSLEIILYDSSPVTQKIFSHILYPYAPNVYHTNKAAELLDKIQYNKPDIIFMDYPASQALEQKTLKSINTKIHSQNIPMILITPKDSPPSDPQNSSANDVLNKPIEATKLTALVNRFVPKTKANTLTQHLQFQQFPPAEQTTKQNELDGQVEQNEQVDLSQQTEQVAQAGPIAQSTATPIPSKNEENKKIDLEPANQDEVRSFKAEISSAQHPSHKELKTVNISEEEAEFQNDTDSPPKTNMTSKPIPADGDMLPLDTGVIEDTPAEAVKDTPAEAVNDAHTNDAHTKDLENKTSIEEVSIQEFNQTESNNSESKLELFKEKEENTVDHPVSSEQIKKTLNYPVSSEQIKNTVDHPVSSEQIEKIVKTEIEATIKKIIDTNIEITLKKSIQEILPELAAKIIKEELNKLLNEDEDES